MKLKANLKFVRFHCPAFRLELGVGQVVSVDKDGIAFKEATSPTIYWIPRHSHYLIQL